MKYLKDIWLDHEERVIEAILEGLVILKSEERLTRLNTIIATEEDDRQVEDKINRELLFCLHWANARLLRKGRGIKSDPQYEQRGQPSEQDLSPPSADYKRVDIRWGYFDVLAALNTEGRGEKYFCIECKRLGSKIPNGKLNPKYVENGILRFILEGHRYGQHVQSGAMIGYLEDMTCEEILQEVNAAIEQVKQTLPPQTKLSPLLSPQTGWQDKATSRLTHQLERSFPQSPFTLWHFWLDLRNCYPRIRKKTKTSNP
jgi:hypothetical protein